MTKQSNKQAQAQAQATEQNNEQTGDNFLAIEKEIEQEAARLWSDAKTEQTKRGAVAGRMIHLLVFTMKQDILPPSTLKAYIRADGDKNAQQARIESMFLAMGIGRLIQVDTTKGKRSVLVPSHAKLDDKGRLADNIERDSFNAMKMTLQRVAPIAFRVHETGAEYSISKSGFFECSMLAVESKAKLDEASEKKAAQVIQVGGKGADISIDSAAKNALEASGIKRETTTRQSSKQGNETASTQRTNCIIDCTRLVSGYVANSTKVGESVMMDIIAMYDYLELFMAANKEQVDAIRTKMKAEDEEQESQQALEASH